jgi:hypothetical protein
MKKTILMMAIFAMGFIACNKKDDGFLQIITPTVVPKVTIVKDGSQPDQDIQVPSMKVTSSATVGVGSVNGAVLLGGNFKFNQFGSFIASRDVKNFTFYIEEAGNVIYTSRTFASVSSGTNSFEQMAKQLPKTKTFTFKFEYEVKTTATDGTGPDDGEQLSVTFYYSHQNSSYDTLGPVTLQRYTFVLTASSTLETGVASTTPQVQNVFGNQEVSLLDEILTSTGGVSTVNKKTYRFDDPSVSTGISMLKMYDGSTSIATANITNGVAVFTNTLSVATTKTITLKAVIGSVNQTLSGKNLKLISDKTEYTDAGGSPKVNDVDRIGTDQYLLRTAPEITKEAVPAFTITNGISREYYRFKVLFPNANGSQQQFTYEFNLVDQNGNDTLLLKNLKIFENGIDVTNQYRITKQNGSIDTAITETDTKLVFTKVAGGGETTFQSGIAKSFSLWATASGFNHSGNSVSVNLIGDDNPPPTGFKYVTNGGIPNSSVKLANGNSTTSPTQSANYIFGDSSSNPSSGNANNSTPDHYSAAVTGKPILDGNGLGSNFFNN